MNYRSEHDVTVYLQEHPSKIDVYYKLYDVNLKITYVWHLISFRKS